MESKIINGVLLEFNSQDALNGKFIVPKGVKELSSRVFQNEKLKEVVLPKGLKIIGGHAFSGCENLININIPKSVYTIELNAFSGCESLRQINIPSGIKKIEQDVFYNSGLEQVKISYGVKEIGDGAFQDCTMLESIDLPSSIKRISLYAFSGCTSIKELQLKNGLKSIGAGAFGYCRNLRTIEIPDSVDFIGNSAFEKCSFLNNIKLPKHIKSINYNVFKGCYSLQSITIPDMVKEIGDNAFGECGELKSITFGSGLKKIYPRAFIDCENLTNLTLPKNLDSLGSACFYNCKKLQTIQLNDNIRSIGHRAFANCKSLKNINLPDSLSVMYSGAFLDCISLESIKIPSQLKYIADKTFRNCKSLKTVELNEGLFQIEYGAFANCYSLEYIKLPESLEEIGGEAFLGCKNLKIIELSSKLQGVGSNVFSSCRNIEKIIIDGIAFKPTQEIIENFGEIYQFLCYAVKNHKFIPKNISIMEHTNKNEIGNFYKYSKKWKSILDAYLKEWKPILSKGTKLELDNAIANLYQASIAMGLFIDGKDGERAEEFLNNVVLKMSPQTIHNLYGALDTEEYGYNKEFADFYIKNYRETAEGLHFMQRMEYDDWDDEEEIVDYTANAYNNWNKVKLAFPNKTVLAHRERGSENNNLTEQDIFNALTMTYYENVDEDNEEMAEMVGKYGYSQEEFEELQKWYNLAKEIPNESLVLRVSPDAEKSGVLYQLLDKTDPEALILGEKTNCCQTVNDAGKSCVEYGITKPNSGFIKFSYNDKIVGQSWVWYNEKTGVICLDNIEVPTIWRNEMNKNEFQKSFIDCVKRLALSFGVEMKKSGHRVNKVAIGSGYNDLIGIDCFKKEETNRHRILPEGYSGYSDADCSWYVVLTKDKTNIIDEESIK